MVNNSHSIRIHTKLPRMLRLKIRSFICLFGLMLTFSSCSNVVIETADNFEVVELPDGSVVYLNHNSSLEYDEDFDPRSVQLSGEIFFNVIEGETPFIVYAELSQIKVLGTKFNVKSDNSETTVEVEEGSVELETKQKKQKVGRGDRAVYKKDGNEIKKGKAEFKFKIWMNSLKLEFKKLGKEIKQSSKQVDKDSKKAGAKIKKVLKKLKKN